MVGFRVIVNALLAGYKVRAAVRSDDKANAIKAAKSMQSINPGSNLTFVHVADVSKAHAYDEAVKGVWGIIHVASPMFSGFQAEEWEEKVVNTAVVATTGMLESAAKEPSVKRVVITSSLYATVPYHAFGGPSTEVWSTTPTPKPTNRPFNDQLEAYAASKVYALHATNEFIKDKKPSFEVVNMMPAYVIGKSELVTKASDFMTGTNPLVMMQILGISPPKPFAGATVHVEDVAQLHVRALDPKIPGGSSFALNSHSPDGIAFNDAIDIVAKNYPERVADGTLPNSGKTDTLPLKYDAGETEKAFGYKFRTYEDQVKSIVDHYLELKATGA